MKITHKFKIMICFFLFVLINSCEKSADQSTTRNVIQSDVLNTREVAACANCPNGSDCCCGIELISPNGVTVTLCGTTDGNTTCSTSAPSPCSSITGGGQSKQLSDSDPKLLFCLAPGNSLAVTNNDATFSAIITITCQHDITHPQTIQDTIPAGATHFLFDKWIMCHFQVHSLSRIVNNFCEVIRLYGLPHNYNNLCSGCESKREC